MAENVDGWRNCWKKKVFLVHPTELSHPFFIKAAKVLWKKEETFCSNFPVLVQVLFTATATPHIAQPKWIFELKLIPMEIKLGEDKATTVTLFTAYQLRPLSLECWKLTKFFLFLISSVAVLPSLTNKILKCAPFAWRRQRQLKTFSRDDDDDDE